MNSDKNKDRCSRGGGRNTSMTPSTALLKQRLGTSPAPRMLTPSEIALLRSSKREMARMVDKVLASKTAHHGLEDM